MTWRTFVQAHGELVAADFFTNYAHLGLAEMARRRARLEIGNPTSAYAKRRLISCIQDERATGQAAHSTTTVVSERKTDGMGGGSLTVARVNDARAHVGVTSNGTGPLVARVKALLHALQSETCDQPSSPSIAASWQPVKCLRHHTHSMSSACIYAAEANSAEAVKWLREAVATGFRVYPLFERNAACC